MPARAGRAEPSSSLSEKVDPFTERQAEAAEVLEQLHVALDKEAARAGAAVERAERASTDVARITSAHDDLVLVQEDLVRRFDQIVERVEQFQATVVAETALAREQAGEEVTGIVAEVSQRLDLLDERAARTAAAERERLQALDEQVQQAVGRVAEALESQRHDQSDFFDRAEASVPVAPAGRVDQGRGRRTGRRGEAGGELAAALVATEIVARDQQLLREDVQKADREARAATLAANRGPAELRPLRADVGLLRQQLAEQNEALDELRKSVEELRPKTPAGKPAAKRASKTTKG